MSRSAVAALALCVGLLSMGGAWAAPALPAAMTRQCVAPKGKLSAEDMARARIAWKYFERNYKPETGLINAVDNYPSVTMWDLASSMAGIIAARELELINQKEFDDKIVSVLGALGSQTLFNGELPNKAYSSVTGQMTDYGNKPSTAGIGYSAIDMGRIVSWLSLLACRHPKHKDLVLNVLRRWNYCRMVKDGVMFGVYLDPAGKPTLGSEGRMGYEQYAAKALVAVGLPAQGAATYNSPYTGEAMIYGLPIRFDLRDSKKYGAYNYVLTESYALDAMEFGLDRENTPLMRNIYEVQKQRWLRTGTVTAITEDHIDRDPWFVYNTIFVDGEPWKAITDTGKDQEALKSVSTKAAFSMAALFPEDPYSAVLLDKVSSAYDPERGWYSGVYERGGYNKSITANTNGIVLQVMLYKLVGALHPQCSRCDRKLKLPDEALKKDSGVCAQQDLRQPAKPPEAAPPKPKPAAAATPPAVQTPAPAPAVGQPAAPAQGGGPAPPAQSPAKSPPPAVGGGKTPAAPAGVASDHGGKPSAPDAGTPPVPPKPDAGTSPTGKNPNPGTSAILPTGSTQGAPLFPAEPGVKLKIGGNLYTSYGLDDRLVTGLIASWAPKENFYVRVGTSYAPLARVGPFRYLWAIGYDDWRDSTLSIQVNHYEPIEPSDGLDLLRAEFQVGYRLPKLCRKDFCAAAYPYVNAPIRIGPALGMQVTGTFRENWFVMAGTSVFVPGLAERAEGERRWTYRYGFGWRDWRPNTPFFTFYNWGPDPEPRRGVLAVGVNWSL